MSETKPKRATRASVKAGPAAIPEPATAVAAASLAASDPANPNRDAFAALAEAQAVIARGIEAMANEMSGISRSGLAAATETATAMLGVRTLAEAYEVQAGMARRSVDAVIDGSAKLSEIGIRAATEATRPILSRWGESWWMARFG